MNDNTLEPSQQRMLVIKFGGSAITEKDSFETLKSSVLDSIAEDVKSVISSGYWNRVVIVHGAGTLTQCSK